MESCKNTVADILSVIGLAPEALPVSLIEEMVHIGETKLLEKLGFVKVASATSGTSYVLVERGPVLRFVRDTDAFESDKIVRRVVTVMHVDTEMFGSILSKRILKLRLKKYESVIKD